MVAENISNLKWAIQSAINTPASTGIYGAYLSGGTPVGPMGEDADFEETTSLRIRSDRFASERHAEGSPEFYVMPNMIASLLYGALGDVTTTGAEDPYTHEIVPAATRPYFTFWRSIGGLIFDESSDCKIDQLVISGESNQPLKVTATVQGLRPRHQSAEDSADVIEVTNRLLYYDGDGALDFEGTAVASFRAFTLTISNNGSYVPGDSLIPIDVNDGQLSIQLQTTQLFATKALMNRKYYGGASPSNDAEVTAAVLELGGTPSIDFTFTRVAASRSLQIEMPRVTVDPFDIAPGTGNDPLTQGLTMNALQPSGDDAITCTVLNGLADLTP